MKDMLHKTRAIILHKIKYTDSGIIVQAYTRDFGRQSFIVRGMRSRKSGKHNVLFQPMFILDIVFYYRESRSIQVLKEFSVSGSPAEIYSDVKKSCIAVFLAELLTSVLKEEAPNKELFDFIEDSIKYLNDSKQGFANFHIAFLAGLSSFLGFEPARQQNTGDKYFDLMNGCFVSTPPLHSVYAEPEISAILAGFFSTSFDRMKSIPLNGPMRNEVLETMIRYFSMHLPGLKKISSLDVLKEIFI
jgi:DNA repair protein RecO (recombination protein O)